MRTELCCDRLHYAIVKALACNLTWLIDILCAFTQGPALCGEDCQKWGRYEGSLREVFRALSLRAFDCARSLKFRMPAFNASFSACSSTTRVASDLRASSTARRRVRQVLLRGSSVKGPAVLHHVSPFAKSSKITIKP